MGVHIGLDLGGTNVKCAVLDGALRVIATDSRPNGAADGEEAVLEHVAELGRSVAEPFGEVASAGLALPGHFDAEAGTGVLLPNLPGEWVGRPIAGPVGDRLGLPVRLVNDVRALTLAELRLGAGRGASDLVCIALGTGVGGGVVIGGRVHLGLGHAGEIGHTTVEPDGPLCGCGNRGCLETLVGAGALLDLLRPSHGHDLTIEGVIELARAGDLGCQRVIADAGGVVGTVVAALCNQFNPERVVVGGELAEARELLLESLGEAVRRYAIPAAGEAVQVVAGALGDRAELLGATVLVVGQSDRAFSGRLKAAVGR